MAAKDKALSTKTLLNPKKITNIINELKEHVDTNLKVWEMIKMWDLAKDINKDNISILDSLPTLQGEVPITHKIQIIFNDSTLGSKS